MHIPERLEKEEREKNLLSFRDFFYHGNRSLESKRLLNIYVPYLDGIDEEEDVVVNQYGDNLKLTTSRAYIDVSEGLPIPTTTTNLAQYLKLFKQIEDEEKFRDWKIAYKTEYEKLKKSLLKEIPGAAVILDVLNQNGTEEHITRQRKGAIQDFFSIKKSITDYLKNKGFAFYYSTPWGVGEKKREEELERASLLTMLLIDPYALVLNDQYVSRELFEENFLRLEQITERLYNDPSTIAVANYCEEGLRRQKEIRLENKKPEDFESLIVPPKIEDFLEIDSDYYYSSKALKGEGK